MNYHLGGGTFSPLFAHSHPHPIPSVGAMNQYTMTSKSKVTTFTNIQINIFLEMGKPCVMWWRHSLGEGCS